MTLTLDDQELDTGDVDDLEELTPEQMRAELKAARELTKAQKEKIDRDQNEVGTARKVMDDYLLEKEKARSQDTSTQQQPDPALQAVAYAEFTDLQDAYRERLEEGNMYSPEEIVEKVNAKAEAHGKKAWAKAYALDALAEKKAEAKTSGLRDASDVQSIRESVNDFLETFEVPGMTAADITKVIRESNVLWSTVPAQARLNSIASILVYKNPKLRLHEKVTETDEVQPTPRTGGRRMQQPEKTVTDGIRSAEAIAADFIAETGCNKETALAHAKEVVKRLRGGE